MTVPFENGTLPLETEEAKLFDPARHRSQAFGKRLQLARRHITRAKSLGCEIVELRNDHDGPPIACIAAR